VAELEGRPRVGGQRLQERAQAAQVLLEEWRGLVKDGPEFAAQAGRDGKEVGDLGGGVGQALLMGDALRAP
jgi:hypothetical protein